MTVHYRVINDELIIVGHTYPHKDQIKALGARFDRMDKAWKLTNSATNQTQVDELCRKLGGGPLGSPAPARQPEPAKPTPKQRPEAEGLTVSELMQQVDMAVRSAFPRTVWVIGEIQNMTERNLGLFFQISEQKAGSRSASATTSVKATVWNNVVVHLQTKFAKGKEDLFSILADGMQARLQCQVTVYKDRGQITLTVVDVDPAFTKGALALAREALLKELRQKGLDQKNKQLPRPMFPFRIGLISAESSRAKSDFLDQLKTYHFPGEVLFRDARMQGDKTPKEVLSALQDLIAEEVDLIVITRGGGSAADLRWFDDRDVALAVANAPVPVLAAIGHHDDVCVTEEIAFQREKTPTAAADFIIHCFQTTRERIDQLADALASHVDRKLEWHERMLGQIGERLGHSATTRVTRAFDQMQMLTQRLVGEADRIIQRQDYQISQWADRLHSTAKDALASKQQQIAELEKALVSRDPMPWIKKGWTQLFGDKGQVNATTQVAVGDKLKARLLDGLVQLSVEEIKKEKKK